MGKYKEIAAEIGDLVDLKNAVYGNSFGKAGEFLKLLYPDGIPPESFDDMLCVVRIFDKLMRIATKKDALGESPYKDICGYGLLGLCKDMEEAETQGNATKPSVSEKESLKTLLLEQAGGIKGDICGNK